MFNSEHKQMTGTELEALFQKYQVELWLHVYREYHFKTRKKFQSENLTRLQEQLSFSMKDLHYQLEMDMKVSCINGTTYHTTLKEFINKHKQPLSFWANELDRLALGGVGLLVGVGSLALPFIGTFSPAIFAVLFGLIGMMMLVSGAFQFYEVYQERAVYKEYVTAQKRFLDNIAKDNLEQRFDRISVAEPIVVTNPPPVPPYHALSGPLSAPAPKRSENDEQERENSRLSSSV